MKDTQEFRKKYRDRLKKIIGTKFQTTMIFPLSQFESAFGQLWGVRTESGHLMLNQIVQSAYL